MSELDTVQLERALADPETRARLAQALTTELKSGKRPRNLRPFLAGLISGAVAVFAFLLPSLQEQWRLYKTGSAVDRYAEIGQHLMSQGHFQPAEQAFARALELAGGQRIDLLQAQLHAHVQRVNDDPDWPGAAPEDVSESDFVYLLELQDAPAQMRQRAETLAAYGAFLAGHKRVLDAEARLREALELDADNVSAHINLGNLLSDRGQAKEAEQEYRRALALNPQESSAYYDLGVLLLETGRLKESEAGLRNYIRLEPDEAEGYRQLAIALRALGRPKEAAEQEQRAKALWHSPRRLKTDKP